MGQNRNSRIRWRAAAGSVSLAAGLALLVIPTVSASAAPPPAQYGASAEGKAIHAIYSAVAAVDPALAATRATASSNGSL